MTGTLQARILANLEADPARPSIAFVDARGSFEWVSREDFFTRAFEVAP